MDFEFEKIKKTRVYEEIVQQMKEYFEKGNIKQGEKLPSERDLAEMFNCSRVSVNQALTILEAQGLVVRKVGEGTFITDDNDYELAQLVSLLNPSPEHAVNAPLEVRHLFEPQIAQLASERATEEDIALMEDSLRRQKTKVERGQLILEEDSEFHYLIARATKNQILVKIVEAIHDMVSETREKSLMAKEGGRQSLEGHYVIFEALKNKDGLGAAMAMEQHLEDVEALMLSFNRDD